MAQATLFLFTAKVHADREDAVKCGLAPSFCLLESILETILRSMSTRCRTRCEDMLRMTAESFPEINSPGLRFITRVFRLRDLIYENAQREMSRFELSPVEYSVLATLRKTPSPHALRPSDIYKGMLITSGGLTKVLKSLEQRGLILREDNAADRRGSRVRLSAAGIELIETAMKTVIGSDIAMLQRVASPEQLDALAEALQPFTEKLDV